MLRSAQRDLKKLRRGNQDLANKCAKFIRALPTDPKPHNVEPVKHKTYLWKYKPSLGYRVVYAVYNAERHCTVVYVGDREDIDYSKLPDEPYGVLRDREV